MSRNRHTFFLTALLCLSAVVQVVIIRCAAVPAQDAVRFAAAAQSYQRDGILRSLSAEPEPPLFPLLVSGTSYVFDAGRVVFIDKPASAVFWATKLQVAAAVPLVLCVVPVYLFTLRWLGATAALATGVLFAVLKEPARLGADGISDSTHLLLVATALWALSMFLTNCGRPRLFRLFNRAPAGVKRATAGLPSSSQNCEILTAVPPGEGAVRFRHASCGLWLALGGAAIGLALLVRPESLLLLGVAITLLPIVVYNGSAGGRLARTAICVSMLVLGLAAVLVPYALLVGTDNTSDFAVRLIGRLPSRDGLTLNSSASVSAAVDFSKPFNSPDVLLLPDGTPMRFVLKETTRSTRFHGLGPAVAEFAGELAGVFQYWLVPFALLAIWQARHSWRRPMNLMAATTFLLFSLAVVLYASRVGYLSGRHLLIPLLLGLPWAGRGVFEASRLLRIWGINTAQRESAAFARASRFVFPAVLTLAALACLSATLQPLHASRIGHRRASEWLIQSDPAAGAVLDSRGWTGLYSGRHTYLCDSGWQAVADPNLAYIVLESWELDLTSRRSRTLRLLVETRARLVATFAEPSLPGAAAVSVYRLDFPAVARQKSDRRHTSTK